MKKKLTIGSIVHIPDTKGFWKDSLKILDICISSIYHNTSQDFDLHIFDNGSCDEVKEYLIEKNKIETYIEQAQKKVQALEINGKKYKIWILLRRKKHILY